MEDKELEELEQQIKDKKLELQRKVEESQIQHATVSTAINNKVMQLFEQSVDKHSDGVKDLTDKAVEGELRIKTEEVAGREKIKKSEIGKGVAEAKTAEDIAKHERSSTILKSQGLVKPIPSLFRITALAFGYPFFIVYLLTIGWILQIITFVANGFITMVAECAERFAEVNKKFKESNGESKFSLGKAMMSILKWVLIVGALTAIVVLLITKK